MACTRIAAELDSEESDNDLMTTTGKGMNPNEKEQRVRRMSVVLMEEMEEADGDYLTLPLVVAVMIASLLTFNGTYVLLKIYSIIRCIYYLLICSISCVLAIASHLQLVTTLV